MTGVLTRQTLMMIPLYTHTHIYIYILYILYIYIYIYIIVFFQVSTGLTRHAGHCWRSRDELISDVLLWTTTYGWAKAG